MVRAQASGKAHRGRWTVKLVLAALLPVGLAGCPSQQRVLDPLPAPVVQGHHIPEQRTFSPPPPQEPRPRPTPAPAPLPGIGRNLRGAVIVVDAGHGGKDQGAWPKDLSALPEKTIVLDIAERIARDLSSRGGRVVRTRTSDVFITLEERAATADRSGCDLFVSIHADSAPRRSASGVGLHIHKTPNGESQRAAMVIQQTLREAGIEVRGIYRNNFHVLREHNRPAILIECGFLTNPGDARNLNNAAYRARLAAAIAEGIARHLSR